MKKTSWMVCCLIIALFYISNEGAFAYGADEQGTYLPLNRFNEGSLVSHSELSDALWSWKESIDSADRVEALEATSRVQSSVDHFGPRNFISLADFFISAGRTAIKNNNYEGAVLAGKNAAMFAPDYPAANFFLADALFKQDKLNISSVVYSMVAGIKSKLTNRLERNRLVSFHMLYFLLSLAVAFVACFLVMLYTNIHTLFADIALRLPFKPGRYVKLAIIALLIILPFALGGCLLFAMALPLLTWPYLRPAGRMIVLLFAIFILIVPPSFKLLATAEVIQKEDTYKTLLSLTDQTWDHEMIAALEREYDSHPDNDLTTFALGNLYHLAGMDEKAIAVYDALLAMDPGNVQVMVNKANIYFELKDYESARKLYNEALVVDPKSVEAHYNLANTYTALFRTKDSDIAYQKARSINPEKTDSFRVALESNPDKKVFGFPITKKHLKQYRKTMSPKVESLASAFWVTYFGATSRNAYYLLAVLFLLVVCLLYLVWHRVIAHQTCSSCGKPFLPPIHVKSPDPRCNQCVATQSTKKVVSTAKKESKRKKIRIYQSRRATIARIMDRVLPGMGRTFFQPTITGFVLTFVTFWLLIYVGVYLYDAAVLQLGVLASYWKLSIIVVAALYWLSMNTFLKREFY